MRALSDSLERILALDDGQGRAVADLLALALVRKALRGNLQAARLIFDHCEGRPEPKNSKREAEKKARDAEIDRLVSETFSRLSDEELIAFYRGRSAPRLNGAHDPTHRS